MISIIVLSWNRELLLRNTILSLLATTKSEFELFIVDNASTDGSKEWLQVFSTYHKNVKVILLEENLGGEAFNIPLSEARGKYILFSENDLEYLPGWDEYMIKQFEKFTDLGQLSPFAPNPMREIGEVWIDKPFEIVKRQEDILLKAIHNVTTTCMIRSELISKGLKWVNLLSKDGLFKFPADASFSLDVKNMGYLVGWSNRYMALNWGFNERVIAKEKEYYEKNWKEKSNLKIDGISLDKTESRETNDSVSQQTIAKLQIENYDLRQKIFTLGGESIQLYFDTGNGFSESDSEKVLIEQDKKKYEIPLDESKNYLQFRLDISNNPIKVMLNSIYIIDRNNSEYKLKIKESNGVLVNEREYIFSNFDPQFYLEPFSKPIQIKKFVLECSQIESNVLVYQTALQISNQAKENIVEEKNKRIESILNSKPYILGSLIVKPFDINSWKKLFHSIKKILSQFRN